MLDRAQLVRAVERGGERAIELPGEAPITIAWPPAPQEGTVADTCRVPDVRGLSLRAAARELHRIGLKMQPRGAGAVSRTDPAAGSLVTRGTVVTVTTNGPGRR